MKRCIPVYICVQFMSVLFAPTPLFALFPLGTETALVVDCGYNETTILAVYNGIPLIGSFTAIPAGAATIHRHIEEKLKEMGAVGADESLDESVLEDIKVRGQWLFSAPTDRCTCLGKGLPVLQKGCMRGRREGGAAL